MLQQAGLSAFERANRVLGKFLRAEGRVGRAANAVAAAHAIM